MLCFCRFFVLLVLVLSNRLLVLSIFAADVRLFVAKVLDYFAVNFSCRGVQGGALKFNATAVNV